MICSSIVISSETFQWTSKSLGRVESPGFKASEPLPWEAHLSPGHDWGQFPGRAKWTSHLALSGRTAQAIWGWYRVGSLCASDSYWGIRQPADAGIYKSNDIPVIFWCIWPDSKRATASCWELGCRGLMGCDAAMAPGRGSRLLCVKRTSAHMFSLAWPWSTKPWSQRQRGLSLLSPATKFSSNQPKEVPNDYKVLEAGLKVGEIKMSQA